MQSNREGTRQTVQMLNTDTQANFNYRILPNRGAGRDSKVKSDTME